MSYLQREYTYTDCQTDVFSLKKSSKLKLLSVVYY